MDLSPLLTKKALIAGGSTTAATTAIVVPVAVTQSGGSNETIEGEKGTKGKVSKSDKALDNKTSKTKDKEKKPKQGESTESKDQQQQTKTQPDKKEAPTTPVEPPKPKIDFKAINTTLPTLGSSLIQSFNKPGDCITRSFSDIENPTESEEENRRGFFFRPDELSASKDPLNHSYNDVFLTTHWSKFENGKWNKFFNFACLTFSKPKEKDNKEFKLEIVIKSDEWGWLWMSGLKKKRDDETKYEFYYKEAALNYKQNKWNIEIGVDGRFDASDTEIAPKFTSDVFKGIQPHEGQECDSEKKTCEQREIRTLFWWPGGNSAIIVPPHENWSTAVLAWKATTDTNGLKYNAEHSKKQRSGVFGNNIWHASNDKQKDTVKFRRSVLDGEGGTWRDWIAFCNDTDNLKKHQSIYPKLCQ